MFFLRVFIIYLLFTQWPSLHSQNKNVNSNPSVKLSSLKFFEKRNFELIYLRGELYNAVGQSFHYLYKFNIESQKYLQDCHKKYGHCFGLQSLPSSQSLQAFRAIIEQEKLAFSKMYRGLLQRTVRQSRDSIAVKKIKSIDGYLFNELRVSNLEKKDLIFYSVIFEVYKLKEDLLLEWALENGFSLTDFKKSIDLVAVSRTSIENEYLAKYKLYYNQFKSQAKDLSLRIGLEKRSKQLEANHFHNEDGFIEFTGYGFKKGEWALTFDDGPHPNITNRILDTLEKNNLHATFFWLAKNILKPQGRLLLQKALNMQMSIANHSYSHSNLNKSNAELDKEIIMSKRIIEDELKGVSVNYFRLPYGSGRKKHEVKGTIADSGMYHFFWTVDSLDWKDPSPESIVKRITTQMEKQGRGIILLHDIQAVTPVVLDLLIEYFNKNNIKIKPLTHIVQSQGFKAANERTWPGPVQEPDTAKNF